MSFLNPKNWAMLATYTRLVLAPIVGFYLSSPLYFHHWLAFILFILAAITDWLDGYWARRYNSRSALGEMMDPVADKILVLAALVYLLDHRRIEPNMLALFLGRDLIMSGLRAAAAGRTIRIPAQALAKWKTALQMIAIPCLILFRPIWGVPLGSIGYFGLWGAILLSWYTLATYVWTERKWLFTAPT